MNNKQSKKVLIVGGGYAGMLAALRLARKTRGTNVQITLVNGLDHFVERIRLHQLAAGQSLRRLAYDDLLQNSPVRFFQGWVSAIAPLQQRVTVQTPAGSVEMPYDYLVYALGSTIETGKVPGSADYALSLRDEKTTLALQQKLTRLAQNERRVLVAGGGLTGIELATEIRDTYPHLRVTLVTADTFGQQLSRRGQQYLRHTFARLGIEVNDTYTITQVHPGHVSGHSRPDISFDLCLWAGSFTVPPLARHAGLPVNEQGQILVDDYLRVQGWPHIYAIGDAASPAAALDMPVRMACATASPMGQYVGSHLAAVIRGEQPKQPFRFRYFGRCISLGRDDGLVQLVTADDTPVERVITGRLGARIKEFICRATIWSFQGEQKLGSLWAWREKRYTGSQSIIEETAV
jgi:NADH:ubiquinone reductase (H+-translocating)